MDPVAHGSDDEPNDSDESDHGPTDEEMFAPSDDDQDDDSDGHKSDAGVADPIVPAGPSDAPPLGPAEAVPVVVAPAAPIAPLADPIALGAPAWALGVERAEINNHGNTKCLWCKDKVAKGAVRFKYWTHASQFRYMHSTCFPHVPLAQRAHSIACLVYQRDFFVGPVSATVDDAIDAALAM